MADQSIYYGQPQGVVPGENTANGQPVYHQYNYQSTNVPPAGSVSPQPGAVYYGIPPPPNQWPQQDESGATFHAESQYVTGGAPGVNALSSQMGALSMDAAGMGTRPAHHRKRPHRHAYHDIGAGHTASPTLQASDAIPSSQFLTPVLNQARSASPIVNPAAPATPTPPPSQGRVDPEQIPSIPRSRDIPAGYYFNHVYPTMERYLPPPAAIPFVAYDQGNSSPKFARLTLNNIPSTADFLSSTALPLGMILQPLARLDPGEQAAPVLDFGDVGPPRCHRCRTYINPFMTFRSGGNKFICNMCTFPNDVSPEYFAPLDPSGARVDRLHRPELMMGTVEFLVPKEYWNKEPVGLNQLILIDVSEESVRRGFLQGVCRGILEALYGKDGEAQEDEDGEATTIRKVAMGSKIGIATFDKEVQFYNLNVSFFFFFFFFFFFLKRLLISIIMTIFTGTT